MNRDEFLARVRGAALSGRRYRVAVRNDLPPRPGRMGPNDGRAERFIDELERVGGVAHRVSGHEAAREALLALVDRPGVKSALCWEHPVLDRVGLDALLADRGVEKWSHPPLAERTADEQRAHMLAADLGITSATLAIAETGTLVMVAGAGSERTASLLPPVHVAIIEEQQIVPDLYDAFDRLAELEEMPSNVTLITGPSKTGDIELRLTTGVHGPGQWHVIVIVDEAPAAT